MLGGRGKHQRLSNTESREKNRETTESEPSYYRKIRLTSVLNLCKAIDESAHKGLKELFEDHKFVACVNKSLALIQHSTKLYLANVTSLSRELFYQILMFKFGNLGFLRSVLNAFVTQQLCNCSQI